MAKIFIRFLIIVLSLVSAALPEKVGLARKQTDNMIDMSRFTLTWSDEFEGDSLDRTKWGVDWWTIERKGGYWHEDMLSVENGTLIISAEYKNAPLVNNYYDKWHNVINFKEYKSGWYSGAVSTLHLFEQKYGYFECRAILPSSSGMWSAFWMMNEGVYNVDGNGQDGTEIDVFESPFYSSHSKGLDMIETNVHYDGYDAAHVRAHVGNYFIENNPYEEFNTYGVEWNENEYIFYINGHETGRTSAGGVSRNAEYLLLTTEIMGNNGVASEDPNGTGAMKQSTGEGRYDFIIDYVRAYQYK